MTLNMFLDACGLAEISLMRGKGREYADTPIGSVYAAADLDWNKEVFVTKADDNLKTKTGASLAGTYWFCNSHVQISRTIKRS